jgi:hypothetical protein
MSRCHHTLLNDTRRYEDSSTPADHPYTPILLLPIWLLQGKQKYARLTKHHLTMSNKAARGPIETAKGARSLSSLPDELLEIIIPNLSKETSRA